MDVHVGTWGHKILADDFAVEVASFYVEQLYAGADTHRATDETIREFGPLDVDEHGKLEAPQRAPKNLPKRPPKLREGDVFRLKLDDERYAFGRVLTQVERAFYRYTSNSKRPPLEEILRSDVLFVVGSTDDGFARRAWHVIGSVPLDDRLRRPTYFYHRAVGDDLCTVFDIWKPDREVMRPADECKEVEQWAGLVGASHPRAHRRRPA